MDDGCLHLELGEVHLHQFVHAVILGTQGAMNVKEMPEQSAHLHSNTANLVWLQKTKAAKLKQSREKRQSVPAQGEPRRSPGRE